MTRIEKLLMHGGTLALGVTGIAYAVFKYLMVNDDPFSAYSHPLQPWTLMLHVLAAPVLVFAVGTIFRDHIIGGMKQGVPGRMKKAGLATMALVIPLILSGYLIQAVSAEGIRSWSRWIHLALGIGFLAFYLAHLAGALRRASRRRALGGIPAGEEPAGQPATIWGRVASALRPPSPIRALGRRARTVPRRRFARLQPRRDGGRPARGSSGTRA